MNIPNVLVMALIFTLAGCSGTEFDQSCGGDTIPSCLPYEASIVSDVSFSPSIPADEALADIELALTLTTCPDAPAGHKVTIQFRADGDETRIFDLAEVRDDGTNGDAEAGDGRIEMTLDNPFLGSDIEGGSSGTIIVRARADQQCAGGECIGGSCQSAPVELSYQLAPNTSRE